jgi:hypothetical protein
MTTELLQNRYEFTRDGKAIIDISVESIGDLFNTFDKKATFTRRELDQDFVEYIIDCVKEIGGHNFVIRVTIDKEYNMLQESILRKAVANHFSFLHQIEKHNFRREIMKFLLLLLLGIGLMAAVSVYKLPDTPEVELWKKIFQEGVVIAAWVAFWEATTTVIFNWSPVYGKGKVYSRIVQAELRVINNLTRFEI